MNSNQSAMVDVESNLSAAAEEEMARFPVATKPASDKIVAEVDSEEEESGFAKMAAGDSSEEEEVRARPLTARVRDAWNKRYAKFFGHFDDTTAAKIPEKPSRKLSAEEVRALFRVGTKLSDKMGGFAKTAAVDSEEGESCSSKMLAEDSEELGPDHIFAAQASCFRDTWNELYSHNFGCFEDTTKIPNMRFTHKKPVHESPVPTATLQIFSIKVAKIWGGLQWPLHVFGIVAVRDVVDHNRNMIFHRPREACQILTQEDPYLKLTGPTRAAVLFDPVTFEVDLQVKGGTQDEDESLSFLAVPYINFASMESRLVKTDYASKLSTVKFELGSIVMSVEATIFLRVRQGSGSWPDGFCARVSARTDSIGTAEVILLDSGEVSRTGDIKLSRCVVSVEIIGELEVCVKAVQGGEIVVAKKKSFNAKKRGVSHGILCLGFCTLDVTVAWSLVSKRRYPLVLEL